MRVDVLAFETLGAADTPVWMSICASLNWPNLESRATTKDRWRTRAFVRPATTQAAGRQTRRA
jgi:hypothetical protein